MHLSASTAVCIIAVCMAGSPADKYILSALAPHGDTSLAGPSTAPTLATLLPVTSSIKDGLELRQAPDYAPIAVSYVAARVHALPAGADVARAEPLVAVKPVSSSDPALVAPAEAMLPIIHAVPPAPPGAMPGPPHVPTTTMPLLPTLTGDDFVTVAWVPTHIGPLETWVPKTITFHFEPMSQAPLPGRGSIGMGTVTGETGQTQTIWTIVAAAPTTAIDSRQALAAAVAIGVVGLVM